MQLDKLFNEDCIEGMSRVPRGSVDLAFADPPFNIGYKYDVYEDRRAADDYLAWTKKWGEALIRTLKPTGTFWLAIGDDFAAELKLIFGANWGSIAAVGSFGITHLASIAGRNSAVVTRICSTS